VEAPRLALHYRARKLIKKLAEKVLECGRNRPAEKVFATKNSIKLQGEKNITPKRQTLRRTYYFGNFLDTRERFS